MSKSIGEALLEWYAENARELPWRGAEDPYRVLVSEVMLQQTRVETVRLYYQRWMERFPTLAQLARAPIDDVLQLWEGLGYYRRAHNLHAAARQIQDQYDGRIPYEARQLRELPGVGEYTAAAVAAIAFGQDQVALDGNLKRVLARLYAVEEPVDRPATARRLRELALEMMPGGHAANFNQALMDLGARVCISGTPRCGECPLRAWCQAFEQGIQQRLPNRGAREAAPLVRRAAVVVTKNSSVLVGKRPADAMLAGLWEFPRFEVNGQIGRWIESWAQSNLGLRVKLGREIGQFSHAYSHFRVSERAYLCQWMSGRPRSENHQDLKWVRLPGLSELPMGKLARSIATALAEDKSSYHRER